MPQPLISIIVPVYGVEAHIGACIDSILTQSLGDFEVLIVDDGSPDDSVAIASRHIGDDPRFRILTRPNGGLSAARNTGLDTARGVFIAFIDSDDRVAPDWLEKMHAALVADNADWVACGLRYCPPGGNGQVHSAIHGAPKPDDPPLPRRYVFTSWSDVIPHYPSAWNKLYRRALIEGLRFDEGTYYEDHAFFHRVACRTDHILHLPEPLYLQTQGREGQITREDSDRVFEQFAVLDTVHGIIDGSDRPGKHEGFQRLASRLVWERSGALSDPERRARYAHACRDYFSQNGLEYSPDWDPAISHIWGEVMEGALPLSVILITDRADRALQDSLTSLAGQTFRDLEILIIDDSAESPDVQAVAAPLPCTRVISGPGRGSAAARNFGLAQARGLYVVFLEAGDVFEPGTLGGWTELMERHGSDFGFSSFRLGLGAGGATHSGFHQTEAREKRLVPGVFDLDPASMLALHPGVSAKIYRRTFLQGADLAFPDTAASEALFTLLVAQTAKRGSYFARPGLRIATRDDIRQRRCPHCTPDALEKALLHLESRLDAQPLPEGWQGRLLARLGWEQMRFAPPCPPEDAADFKQALAEIAGRHGWSGATLDPHVAAQMPLLLSPASDGASN